MLSAYTGKDVILTLPEGKHWGWGGVQSFSIWCRRFTENFGDVLTNLDYYLLPPYIADESMVSDDLHHG